MKKISRRKFLTTTGIVIAAAAATGLGISIYRDEKTFLKSYKEVNFVDRKQAPQAARVALINGRFADVRNGLYFTNTTSLVIESGKILAMPGLPGQPEQIAVDRVIDLQGRAVIPGLFNTHCHIENINPGFCGDGGVMVTNIVLNNLYSEWQRAKALADCLARGVTNIRDAWAEDLNINRRFKDEIARGEIPGPRIYQSVLVSPKGGAFAPERTNMDRMMWFAIGLPQIDYNARNSGVVTFPVDASPDQVRSAVDRAIDERGADYIKIYDQRSKRLTTAPGAVFMSLEQMQAITDQSRRRGVGTQMHHVTAESFQRGVQSGVNTLSHMPMDASLTEADIRAFLESGCAIEPTISIGFAGCWKVAGKPWSSLPQMDSLEAYRNTIYQQFARQYWVPPLGNQVKQIVEINRLGAPNPALDPMFDYFKGTLTYGLENTRRLAEAGAAFACGNDAGAVQVTAAAIPVELDLFNLFYNRSDCPAQFTPADLLRIPTLNSAIAMGLEKDFGTLEPGKVADLVILDGDPYSDPTCIGSIAAAVFKDGVLAVNNIGLAARSPEAE